jgi:hypothetical protein
MPPRAFDSPLKFAKRMFETEVRAYGQLRALQGELIPQLYGHYHIEFPDRECHRDQVVYTCLFELVDGIPLLQVPLLELPFPEAEALWGNILNTINAIHFGGVVKLRMWLRKLFWRKDSQTDEIVCVDFTEAEFLEDYDVRTRNGLIASEYTDLRNLADASFPTG